jgi:hypothetical protein
VSTPSRLSEEEAAQQLQSLLLDVENWRKRWEVGALGRPVETGSSLAGDDRRSDPYQVSHAIIQLTTVAVDHLHALKVLVGDARKLHNSAPYTLVRSAIEAASTALWILAPRDRPTRLLRRLSHAAQDVRDGTLMAQGAKVLVPREFSQRSAELELMAQHVAGASGKLERLNLTQILREVDSLNFTDLQALAAWRTCSAFAHGRLWSSLSLLEREVFPSGAPNVATLRLTNSLSAVLWPTWVAHDLVVSALQLYEQRAQTRH